MSALLLMFKAVPIVRWAELALIAAVIGLMTTAYLMQHNTIMRQKVTIAERDKTIADQRAAYATAALGGIRDAQDETKRRVTDQGEIANESQRFTTRALADAGDRRTADERLRNATATVAASCGPSGADPTPAAVSAPASSPGDLLANVQRRLGEAAGRIGEYADAARGAGQQCQADYDALTPSTLELKAGARGLKGLP